MSEWEINAWSPDWQQVANEGIQSGFEKALVASQKYYNVHHFFDKRKYERNYSILQKQLKRANMWNSFTPW